MRRIIEKIEIVSLTLFVLSVVFVSYFGVIYECMDMYHDAHHGSTPATIADIRIFIIPMLVMYFICRAAIPSIKNYKYFMTNDHIMNRTNVLMSGILLFMCSLLPFVVLFVLHVIVQGI
jgi:hypothetical protein